MKKPTPHVIWVSPSSDLFFRSKGEVRSRPGSIIPKLVEAGIFLDVLIPYDPTLLPKTKLSAARTTHHTVRLAQDYAIEIIKLTRGAISPGIYMAVLPSGDSAITSALLCKAALALARQNKRPVDIFHVFDWEAALLPLYLELDKESQRLFKNTRTFLNVSSLREHGSFAPSILNHIGIPKTLFHPEGLEFYGRVSFLKAGLIFADGVGLVEGTASPRHFASRNGHGFEGILDAQSHKLRRWASSRSLKSHLEAYKELLQSPVRGRILPHLLEKVQAGGDAQWKQFIESWGPPVPERYNANALSFLIQSPTKAYAFWEWARHDYVDYGLILEDRTTKHKKLLSRGLQALSEYWIDVHPDHEYVVEIIGYDKNGRAHPLLRSRAIRTPRSGPSRNRRAIFVDVRTRRRFVKDGVGMFDLDRIKSGGNSSAYEWTELPSSSMEAVPSK